MGSVLFEKAPRDLSCHMRPQQEDSILEPGSRSSPDSGSAATLSLDFPASRILRNHCLLSEVPRLSYFC